MPRPKMKPHGIATAAILRPETRKQLEDKATREERTLSQTIERILRSYFDKKLAA
jgi:hypothetical protein